MAVIDTSYFVSELLIPNISGTHAVVTENVAKLNKLITKYEKSYLRKLLGDTLYDVFITDLTASESWAVDLRDQMRDTVNKVSPIANYVFYFWMKDSLTYTTSGGTIEQKSENGTQATAMRKMMDAWNDMVDLNDDLVDYMNDNYSSFPETPNTDLSLLRKINTFNI